MKRKILCSSLALAMLLGGTACEKKEETGKVNNASSEFAITDEPLTMSMFMHYRNSFIYDEEFPIFKEAEKMTNVYLEGVASKSMTNSDQAYQLMLSSNKLPDIIHGNRQNSLTLGPEGALIPLNDLIEEHAPNIKKILNDYPEYRRQITAPDGNIYMVAGLSDPIDQYASATMGYWIRKDWLDKLGMELPDTYEEYYNALVAFRDKDPNGNGIADEIPFFSNDSGEFIRVTQMLSGFRSSWFEEDGKVNFAPFDKRFQAGLIMARKWYDEGIVDKEIFTRGANARDILLGNNTGGSTHSWMSTMSAFNDKLKEKVPDMNLTYILPPKDVNGNRWEEHRNYPAECTTEGWGISSANEHPVETIKYFDFWFSDAGRRLVAYGVEGTHYEMADGKPKYLDEVVNGDTTIALRLQKDGALSPTMTDTSAGFEFQNPLCIEGIKAYVDNNVYTDNKFVRPNILPFTPDENKEFSSQLAAAVTYMSEMQQKFILGGADPVNDFDEYLKKFGELGMTRVIELCQEKYDEYITK